MPSIRTENNSVIRTDFDKCEIVLKQTHQVSFDLQDLVLLVEEQSNKGLTGHALSAPHPRFRLLCDPSMTSASSASSSSGFQQNQGKKQDQQQQQQDNNNNNNNANSGPKSFAQALWDKGVHLFRLLRHLGKPIHTVPSLEYFPGDLLVKIDQYNTELELLLLRSRSGKGSDDELCYQFVRGCCPRGASCSFAHSKLAVSTWSQRWASEHLRDYSTYKVLLKQHYVQHVDAKMFSKKKNSAWMMNNNNELEAFSPIPKSLKSREETTATTTISSSSSATKNNVNNNINSSGSKSLLGSIGKKKKEEEEEKLRKEKELQDEQDQEQQQQQQNENDLFLHPLNAGAVLRAVEDTIGPEAFSIALDMLHQRDEVLTSQMRDPFSGGGSVNNNKTPATNREGKLQSIIMRNPFAASAIGNSAVTSGSLSPTTTTPSPQEQGFPKHVFDVFLSMIDLNLFSSLRALDFSKCDIGMSCGKGRLAKFGRSLRRSGHLRDQNRFNLSLGTNSLSNTAVSAFLGAFAATGREMSNNNNNNNNKQNGNNNNNNNSNSGRIPASVTSNVTTPRNNNNNKSNVSKEILDSTLAANNASFGGMSFVTANQAAQQLIREASLEHNNNNNNNNNNINDVNSALSIAPNAIFDTEKVIDSLNTLHPLLAINLEFNGIGPSQPDFSEFIASLQECLPYIEKLSLSGNAILHDGAARLFPSWRINSTLSSNSNNNSFTSGNFFFCALQYLDVAGCGLGDRGVNVLCETIRMNGNNVKYLNVGWNGITADGAAIAVSDLLRQKNSLLKCLRLDYSPQFGRRGAILISQAIKENTVIRRLDLRWCYIGDEGALAILDSLGTSRNTSLAVLKCDSHEVDSRTRDALQERLGMVAATCKEELMKMEVDVVW